ncbi:MAG: hypothetical protein WDM70_04695 [Nitrosomonadales bacterium]
MLAFAAGAWLDKTYARHPIRLADGTSPNYSFSALCVSLHPAGLGLPARLALVVV